ncbi:MAG: hypothetical protein ACPL3B_01110, partial [Fervidobacterium sp.]
TQVPEKQEFIIADVLRLFNLDPRKIKDYKLLKNGEKAGFTDTLESGDEIIFEYEELNEKDA